MSSHHERDEAVVFWLDDGCDGLGWYWADAEYPEEGVVGAYFTQSGAMRAARRGDYEPRLLRGPNDPGLLEGVLRWVRSSTARGTA